MNLLVVSHVRHYRSHGQLHAYGPYVREIEIWADLFDHVRIASPCVTGAPAGDALPFTRPNISIVPQRETGGPALRAKLKQFALTPFLVLNLCRAMRQTDAIHVRCPGNLGLLGILLAPLFSRRCVVKYAGQWGDYPGEAWSVRLQRRVLRSWWWRNGLVTVYGQWPDQPRQIIPFFTSMMSEQQVRKAATVAACKRLTSPVEVLFSGRLSANKNVDLLLRALAAARHDWRLTVAGDGVMRPQLETLAASLGIADRVRFLGAIPYDEMMRCYERCHVLVLPSYTEGWPKVLAEAMCHGLVCAGTAAGLMPWLLDRRGYTFPAGDHRALGAILNTIFDDPAEFERRSCSGAEWARQYSLESLRSALDQLFRKHWGESWPAEARVDYRAATIRERCS